MEDEPSDWELVDGGSNEVKSYVSTSDAEEEDSTSAELVNAPEEAEVVKKKLL